MTGFDIEVFLFRLSGNAWEFSSQMWVMPEVTYLVVGDVHFLHHFANVVAETLDRPACKLELRPRFKQ